MFLRSVCDPNSFTTRRKRLSDITPFFNFGSDKKVFGCTTLWKYPIPIKVSLFSQGCASFFNNCVTIAGVWVLLCPLFSKRGVGVITPSFEKMCFSSADFVEFLEIFSKKSQSVNSPKHLLSIDVQITIFETILTDLQIIF